MTAIEREFVSSESPTMPRAGAGGRPCQGLYHRPAGGQPRVAIIATHYEVDFSEHYLADFVAARGLGFLGWNTRYRGNGAWFRLDQAVGDIGIGVRWLREEAGVETVVILGNSGGASLMGAYQSRALDQPDELPTGELFISLCAHPGRPDVLTTWLDPAVVDERDPIPTDPALDMFDPDQRAALRARVRGALPGRPGGPQRPRSRRGATTSSTGWSGRHPRPAVHDQPAVGRPPLPRPGARSLGPAGRVLRRRSGRRQPRPVRAGVGVLAAHLARHVEPGRVQCRATPHLGRITAPALVVQSTGDQGCFLSDARAIHDELGSTDKRIELVPGDHYLRQPDGAREALADLVVAWVGERT